MTEPKILVFAGSARQGSLNKKLARLASDIARDLGAEVTFLDLRDHPLPLYDGDLEQEEGLPEAVVSLKELFKAQDGFVIVSPEYNGSFSPLMKNVIDWASRQGDDAGRLEALAGKAVGLLAAAPGPLDGVRGLAQIRQLLGGLGTYVSPKQHALKTAGKAFDDEGGLLHEADQAAVKAVVADVIDLARKLKA